MPGKKATDGSNSKWTRMWFDVDMANCNIRREHLAHILHYKINVHEMKRISRELGRPIKILDVGCGESNTVRLFYTADQTEKKKVIKEYVGLEGDPSCVARTEKKAATILRGINGRVEVCDITKGEFPVNPGSMDLIVCNEVLEHIPQDKVPTVLRAMRRSARSTATFLISTPNKDGTNDRLPADHVYEWRFEELREEFEKAGLEVVDTRGIYIKQANLRRYIKETEGDEMLELVDRIWDRYGLDVGSIMTADLAVPVANNVLWVLKKKGK